MEDKLLELRMYFFVIYQLGGVHKGIQSGHAALDYALAYGNTDEYKDFILNWKTWIILNGGTTNDELDIEGNPLGSLNQIGDSLNANGINFTYFREPDLNNSLTSLCFLVDERVFNKKDYPDFKDHIIENYEFQGSDAVLIRIKDLESLKTEYSECYKQWIRLIGGVKNAFLRELLKDKKLA